MLKLIKPSIQIRKCSILASSLKYQEFGEPHEVLKIVKEEIMSPKENEIQVKVLVSPINPADVNTIQGKYPVKPTFPAVGGNECVAEVIAVGSNVKSIKPKDRVIPFVTGLGTWRTYANFPENSVMKISDKIDLVSAATITVNPCTAYRMLKDFKTLEKGDTVIQNGANSGVGQAVHQLCKIWGINSIGIVRDRPDIDNLKNYLKNIGASEILTEEELRTTNIFKTQYKKPILGLNCVGGKSATEITRHLANNGELITYGGMSREPLTISTATLIFKNVKFSGFWMTRWTKENSENPNRFVMFNELCKLIESNKFLPPINEVVNFQNYEEAMKQAMNFKGFTGKKFILSFC